MLKNEVRVATSTLDQSPSLAAHQTQCMYVDYLKKCKALSHVFRTSHYELSPQRYILDWALVAVKAHITSLEVRDNLNVVRATNVYTRYTSANKSQLP